MRRRTRHRAPRRAPWTRARPPGRRCLPRCRRSTALSAGAPRRTHRGPRCRTPPCCQALPDPSGARTRRSLQQESPADTSGTGVPARARRSPNGRSCCPCRHSSAHRPRTPPLDGLSAAPREANRSSPVPARRAPAGEATASARATFPSVSLPASPYSAVSAAGPIPSPSRTMIAARRISVGQSFRRRTAAAGAPASSAAHTRRSPPRGLASRGRRFRRIPLPHLRPPPARPPPPWSCPS